jgi:hypothetical protein
MEEREYFSDWMAHSVEMQLSTYDKRLAAGEVQPLERSAGAHAAPARDESRENKVAL